MQQALIDKPGQIFNCNESGFPLQHKLQGVIALKEAEHLSESTDHSCGLC